MSTNPSAKGSKRSRKDRSDVGSKQHPMEEIVDDMSSIHGDDQEYRSRDRIEEGVSKRTAGRNQLGAMGGRKDKSSKGGFMDKDAQLRGEAGNMHAPEMS